MPFLMRCPILENASRTSESEESFSSGEGTVVFFFFFFARGEKKKMDFVAKQDISCLQVRLKQLALWFSSSTRPVAVAEYHYPETILSSFDFSKRNKVFNLGPLCLFPCLAIWKFLHWPPGSLAELDAKKPTPESDCCPARQKASACCCALSLPGYFWPLQCLEVGLIWT